MSKQPQRQPEKIVAPVPQQAAPVREIEDFRRCPLCWGGHGGYGVAYSTQGNRRYYRCVKTTNPQHGPCGHTWVAIVSLEVIRVESRTVRLDGER